MQPYDMWMAIAHGRRAVRRGDLAAAERWFKLAESAVRISQRISQIACAEEENARRAARAPFQINAP